MKDRLTASSADEAEANGTVAQTWAPAELASPDLPSEAWFVPPLASFSPNREADGRSIFD